MSIRNEVQLITYTDRLGGGGLQDLHGLLAGQLAGLFGTVHILPFFDPIDGADTGFDPVDHTKVDPRLGDWQDIKSLSSTLDIAADLIVNHVSSDSVQFRDYLQSGTSSPYSDMFLTEGNTFEGGVSDQDLARVYRPRPTSPLTEFSLSNGRTEKFWTTFTDKQIDIDVRHSQSQRYLRTILQTLSDNGVKLVRLDAVGYAIKTKGTSCFMTPETYQFIEELTAWCHELGMQVLAETHTHYERQLRTAKHVDWVYDFALPPLLLHTLYESDTAALKHWFSICPQNAISVLDTHDGIGVMDVGPDAQNPESEGLLAPEFIDSMVENIHVKTKGASKRASRSDVGNLDLYQVNSTYYSALGEDDSDYLLARLVQFFAPGIPQVYYVGLLAGENDEALFEANVNGRDINRARFSPSDIESSLQRPVVQQLCSMIRFRNTHPAFSGSFECLPSSNHELKIRRQLGGQWAELWVDFKSRKFEVRCSGRDNQLSRFSDFDTD